METPSQSPIQLQDPSIGFDRMVLTTRKSSSVRQAVTGFKERVDNILPCNPKSSIKQPQNEILKSSSSSNSNSDFNKAHNIETVKKNNIDELTNILPVMEPNLSVEDRATISKITNRQKEAEESYAIRDTIRQNTHELLRSEIEHLKKKNQELKEQLRKTQGVSPHQYLSSDTLLFPFQTQHKNSPNKQAIPTNNGNPSIHINQPSPTVHRSPAINRSSSPSFGIPKIYPNPPSVPSSPVSRPYLGAVINPNNPLSLDENKTSEVQSPSTLMQPSGVHCWCPLSNINAASTIPSVNNTNQNNNNNSEPPEIQVIFEGKSQDLQKCLKKFARKIAKQTAEINQLKQEKEKVCGELDQLIQTSKQVATKYEDNLGLIEFYQSKGEKDANQIQQLENQIESLKKQIDNQEKTRINTDIPEINSPKLPQKSHELESDQQSEKPKEQQQHHADIENQRFDFEGNNQSSPLPIVQPISPSKQSSVQSNMETPTLDPVQSLTNKTRRTSSGSKGIKRNSEIKQRSSTLTSNRLEKEIDIQRPSTSNKQVPRVSEGNRRRSSSSQSSTPSLSNKQSQQSPTLKSKNPSHEEVNTPDEIQTKGSTQENSKQPIIHSKRSETFMLFPFNPLKQPCVRSPVSSSQEDQNSEEKRRINEKQQAAIIETLVHSNSELHHSIIQLREEINELRGREKQPIGFYDTLKKGGEFVEQKAEENVNDLKATIRTLTNQVKKNEALIANMTQSFDHLLNKYKQISNDNSLEEISFSQDHQFPENAVNPKNHLQNRSPTLTNSEKNENQFNSTTIPKNQENEVDYGESTIMHEQFVRILKFDTKPPRTETSELDQQQEQVQPAVSTTASAVKGLEKTKPKKQLNNTNNNNNNIKPSTLPQNPSASKQSKGQEGSGVKPTKGKRI